MPSQITLPFDTPRAIDAAASFVASLAATGVRFDAQLTAGGQYLVVEVR